MNKAHATQAVLGGHSIFWVRSFKVLAPLMRPVVEPCVVAAKSSDARDKYFAVAVGSFDPSSGAALRSELPALDSAGAAVAAAVTELAEAVPDARALQERRCLQVKGRTPPDSIIHSQESWRSRNWRAGSFVCRGQENHHRRSQHFAMSQMRRANYVWCGPRFAPSGKLLCVSLLCCQARLFLFRGRRSLLLSVKKLGLLRIFRHQMPSWLT